jgi:hypothetical protein
LLKKGWLKEREGKMTFFYKLLIFFLKGKGKTIKTTLFVKKKGWLKEREGKMTFL